MPFAVITSLRRRISYLRTCSSGIVPPWYREHCEGRIRVLEMEVEKLCLDC